MTTPKANSITETIPLDILAEFIPLSSLDYDCLHELQNQCRIVDLYPGKRLFSKGNNDEFVYYLYEGSINLDNGRSNITLTHEMPEAYQAIAPKKPRKFTVTANTPSTFIAIDSNLLDIYLSLGHNQGYLVEDIPELQSVNSSENWMVLLLQTRIFHRISPVNIQMLFNNLQILHVSKGDVIIEQDQIGDYYYFIKQGNCSVIRFDSASGGINIIAELAPGQGFGEEALISGKRRNATIQMSTDGILLRLSKEHFNKLLQEPLITMVEHKQLDELLSNGAQCIDVRTPEEYQIFHLEL